MPEPNDSRLPQNVRVGSARSFVRQALAVATANYGLTIQEAAMVAECVLGDARADLLAFTVAQYERLATPEQAREPTPAKEGEAKAS